MLPTGNKIDVPAGDYERDDEEEAMHGDGDEL